ncbi:Histone chaperone asf1 [Bacidia gigantensis]|uniref:Histone chaperone asf1 n=1 Tax=Bacidia gigantensis TaxID=2732470 RepID=UPI001D045EDC|nr:Histone chaperone asf1 [Bacidia gigantensis]KAG8529181.1 Histone chaperone asf1 [Bacidia gigantensis]
MSRSEHDQELDSLFVGPIPTGTNKFVFEADPPDLRRIPSTEILGVTVILLTCSYDDREFVRVGYYVNNEYDSDELNADPPQNQTLTGDTEDSAPAEFPPEQPEADQVEDDGVAYGQEEVELEEGLKAELAAEEAKAAADGEDEDMGGADDTAGAKDEDDSDAGSEDLEADTSGSEEEDEEEVEEEGEGEGDEDMEMGDGASNEKKQKLIAQQHNAEVMVH